MCIRDRRYAEAQVALHERTQAYRRGDDLRIAQETAAHARAKLPELRALVAGRQAERGEFGRLLGLGTDTHPTPSISLSSGMARERKVMQPVGAHGRTIIPTAGHYGKNGMTARERLDRILAKELLTGDELTYARILAAQAGVTFETVRIELNAL